MNLSFGGRFWYTPTNNQGRRTAEEVTAVNSRIVWPGQGSAISQSELPWALVQHHPHRHELSQSHNWGRYHGGRRPPSDDSFHSPTVIPHSALDKPSIMTRSHRRRTTRRCVTARSRTMVTLHSTQFVKCRIWNGGWTVKTVVTWRSSASMIPTPGSTAFVLPKIEWDYIAEWRNRDPFDVGGVVHYWHLTPSQPARLLQGQLVGETERDWLLVGWLLVFYAQLTHFSQYTENLG